MNIAVVGNILAVTSSVKAADLKNLGAANKEALKLVNEDKEVIFAVGVGETGSIAPYGITFNTTDATGNAVVTLNIENIAADKRVEYVAKTYYKAFEKLAQLEEQITNAVTEYNRKVREITDVVTVL